MLTLLCVLLASLAMTHREPPPPTIAEFAPQAVTQIRDVVEELAGAEGRSAGAQGPGADGLGPVAATTKAAIDVARARNCIGDPPRQIEDPQSPPCVPYWDGDNGGSTWRGVTADEIRVVAPHWPDDNLEKNSRHITPDALAMEQFYNRRFEFYGRHIRLLPLHVLCGSAGACNEANGVAAAEELDAFASLPTVLSEGRENMYHDALARRGVLSVYSAWTFGLMDSGLERYDPYQWAVAPGFDGLQRNQAEWMCRQLAGRAPSYAGPDVIARAAALGQNRIFGALVFDRDHMLDTTSLHESLRSCDERIEVEVQVTDYADGSAENAILQMRQAGVTSILTYVHSLALNAEWFGVASAYSYRPEWLVSSFAAQTTDAGMQSSPPDQSAHVFGIHFVNKTQIAADRPERWALDETDPQQGSPGWYRQAELFWPFLVLASGIQMAGPRLTPETFRDGLFRTQFQNPNAGRPPYYQAHVGFGPNDHSFYDDASVVWWSQSAVSKENAQPGAYCPVYGGARFKLGTWPSDPMPLFNGECE